MYLDLTKGLCTCEYFLAESYDTVLGYPYVHSNDYHEYIYIYRKSCSISQQTILFYHSLAVISRLILRSLSQSELAYNKEKICNRYLLRLEPYWVLPTSKPVYCDAKNPFKKTFILRGTLPCSGDFGFGSSLAPIFNNDVD